MNANCYLLSSPFQRASIAGQTHWGQGSILLPSQAAVLFKPDAGSDGVEPASDFVIQTCQTSCSLLCLM